MRTRICTGSVNLGVKHKECWGQKFLGRPVDKIGEINYEPARRLRASESIQAHDQQQYQGRARSKSRNSPNFRCTHPANGGRQVTKLPGNRSISISRYLKHILFFSNSIFFERKIISKIAKNCKNPRFHSKYPRDLSQNCLVRCNVKAPSKNRVGKLCTRVSMLRMLR